ncbi:uncharacterized protein LOC141746199 [Larus michahellis]|uniref:uncharacterized protein LOC141746199 n=1 Tax=Larus michahellis TaxID=119627 RepID=UPI003D9B7066
MTETCSFSGIRLRSCLPKLEKRVLMRNVLREVWDGFFFQWKRRIPSAEERSHTSRFPFTEVRRQCGLIAATSPSRNCFSMDSCVGQGRSPASLLLFLLYNYPSKAVAPLTTRSSHLQLVRRSHREVSRRWARRLVFLICISLGSVKFIFPCRGNIFSSERWEQSQLKPCKSNKEQSCCPKEGLRVVSCACRRCSYPSLAPWGRTLGSNLRMRRLPSPIDLAQRGGFWRCTGPLAGQCRWLSWSPGA